jgi:hypothetical protein
LPELRTEGEPQDGAGPLFEMRLQVHAGDLEASKRETLLLSELPNRPSHGMRQNGMGGRKGKESAESRSR